ncbi:MAG: hypothetical protein JNL82_03590 [Myxococcales bacterium]|nr:hypothetical protein [Myxococcales bacterium]
MRIAYLVGAVLFTASLWLGACGPPYPGANYCGPSGKDCQCSNVPNCVYDCPVGGCDAKCHDVDNCDVGCGDACHFDCHNTVSCDGVCGDDCKADCHDASVCTVDCGADCQVDCHNLDSCSVIMISGEVHCHDNGDCDIQCRQPNGALAPADNCGKNRWRCGC